MVDARWKGILPSAVNWKEELSEEKPFKDLPKQRPPFPRTDEKEEERCTNLQTWSSSYKVLPEGNSFWASKRENHVKERVTHGALSSQTSEIRNFSKSQMKGFLSWRSRREHIQRGDAFLPHHKKKKKWWGVCENGAYITMYGIGLFLWSRECNQSQLQLNYNC